MRYISFSFFFLKKRIDPYAFIPHPKQLLLCIKCNRPGCTCILLRQLRCAKLKPMNLEITLRHQISNETKSLIRVFFFSLSYLRGHFKATQTSFFFFFPPSPFAREGEKLRKTGQPPPPHVSTREEEKKKGHAIPHTSLNP